MHLTTSANGLICEGVSIPLPIFRTLNVGRIDILYHLLYNVTAKYYNNSRVYEIQQYVVQYSRHCPCI